VLPATFNEAVREYTGSATYTSDRGLATVGAKTVGTAPRPGIVVNSLAAEPLRHTLLKRLLAHETGHVLMNAWGESVQGHRGLVRRPMAVKLSTRRCDRATVCPFYGR
jgi:hypothetical protein